VFNKLLIANRGEIACRIIRTAKRMGIETVAVYSDADESALHVRSADQAVRLGPAPVTESYLNQAALLDALGRTGADAVHPGYGFFSENADFAESVTAGGIVFIGPPAAAIREMGAKDNAKAIMEHADVPVVPGYYGDNQTLELFAREADRIGYPVLLKAALGGGGKGMRIVRSENELADFAASARREAESAFGNGRLLIEKYLTGTRHVEIQVFADSHGSCVHLFERDCSLQRRHQKIIEEAPAPGLTEVVRQEMGAAAVRAAKAVNYEGAGTIEFLLTPEQEFYFMEMNTRLQVEHPVTEMITGTDLVEWQIRVADGQKLPLQQYEIGLSGHAIEVRLYAEDTSNNFMPAPGQLKHIRWPENIPGMRVDTGVETGDVISSHYDPMIAKMILFGESREQARRRLSDALCQLEIVGPGHNTDFLYTLVNHPAFCKSEINTAFVDNLMSKGIEKTKPSIQTIAAAALHVVRLGETNIADRAARSEDPHSPWNHTGCWRLNDQAHMNLVFIDCNDTVISVAVSGLGDDNSISITIDGDVVDRDVLSHAMMARIIDIDDAIHIFGLGPATCLWLFDPILAASELDRVEPTFTAPMPGKIAAVLVANGDNVAAGDILVVVEAMKMEHAIKAPKDGVVEKIQCSMGEQVDEGQILLTMIE